MGRILEGDELLVEAPDVLPGLLVRPDRPPLRGLRPLRGEPPIQRQLVEPDDAPQALHLRDEGEDLSGVERHDSKLWTALLHLGDERAVVRLEGSKIEGFSHGNARGSSVYVGHGFHPIVGMGRSDPSRTSRTRRSSADSFVHMGSSPNISKERTWSVNTTLPGRAKEVDRAPEGQRLPHRHPTALGNIPARQQHTPPVGGNARQAAGCCGCGCKGTHIHDGAGLNRDATPLPPGVARGRAAQGRGTPPPLLGNGHQPRAYVQLRVSLGGITHCIAPVPVGLPLFVNATGRMGCHWAGWQR